MINSKIRSKTSQQVLVHINFLLQSALSDNAPLDWLPISRKRYWPQKLKLRNVNRVCANLHLLNNSARMQIVTTQIKANRVYYPIEIEKKTFIYFNFKNYSSTKDCARFIIKTKPRRKRRVRTCTKTVSIVERHWPFKRST